MEPKTLHDHLMANMPEGAEHDAASCAFCTPVVAIEPTSASAKEDAVSEFTKDQLEAAVAEATAAANARVTELEAQVKAFAESQHQEAIDAAVANASTEAQAKIDGLQEQLDAAVLEANTHKEAFEKFQTELTELEEARTAEEQLAAKREERVAKVAEVANFPEEHVKANADRWAAMSDEQFEQQLEDWRLIASKENTTVPSTTRLQAHRDKDQPSTSATREVFGLLRQGVDTRTI